VQPTIPAVTVEAGAPISHAIEHADDGTPVAVLRIGGVRLVVAAPELRRVAGEVGSALHRVTRTPPAAGPAGGGGQRAG